MATFRLTYRIDSRKSTWIAKTICDILILIPFLPLASGLIKCQTKAPLLFIAQYSLISTHTMASEKEIHTLTIDVGNLLLFRKTKKNRAVFLLRGECPGGGGGGGYSLEFLVGVCRTHLQIQTQFQTKNCHFPHPFSDLTLHSICISAERKST